MNASEIAALRLVASLEEFTAQQALAISVGHAAHAVDLQRRAAPLVERLCELAREPGLARTIARRLDDLMESRRALQGRLAARRELVNARRQRVALARSRLQSLAPAYGVKSGRAPLRLNAAV